MTEKAELILAQLNFITPVSIGVKTDASESIKDSFHSVWYRHSPQAARFMLLPYVYDGRINFTS